MAVVANRRNLRMPPFGVTALAIVMTFCSSHCFSMDFELRNESDPSWIYAHGDIERGDSEKFISFFESIDPVYLVVLVSDGGNLFESMQLGRKFRALRIDTLVPSAGQCYSACFLAMIGGNKRYVSPEGVLGFHQFSGSTEGASGAEVQKTSQSITSDVIDYVLKMGVDAMAVARGLSMPPEEMYIFSSNEMDSMGINAYPLNESSMKTEKESCPFPDDYKVKDPMGLYPGCKNRE